MKNTKHPEDVKRSENVERFKIKKIKIGKKEIKTPFFMPDATRGFIKGLSNNEVLACNTQAMVVNTFHLYLAPGMEIIKKAGGIHKFINWDGILLSDSGGFQVFSLIHQNPKMGKIYEDKVVFKSPLDGTKHELTPEKSIQIQFDLGVDMMVCLDDCPPNTISRALMRKSIDRTIRWAKRCKVEYLKQVKERGIKDSDRPLLFSVIQGGAEINLREYCTEKLVEIDFDGYGFGARPVDKDGNFLEEVLTETAEFIPDDKIKFALGIGLPEDIARCYKMGWDIFDCVIPTREARHGKLFQFNQVDIESENFYNTFNITNSKFKTDFSKINKNSKNPLLQEHTKAYLYHLFKMKDPLGAKLASLNNLEFYNLLFSDRPIKS